MCSGLPTDSKILHAILYFLKNFTLKLSRFNVLFLEFYKKLGDSKVDKFNVFIDLHTFLFL